MTICSTPQIKSETFSSCSGHLEAHQTNTTIRKIETTTTRKNIKIRFKRQYPEARYLFGALGLASHDSLFRGHVRQDNHVYQAIKIPTGTGTGHHLRSRSFSTDRKNNCSTFKMAHVNGTSHKF